MARFIFLIATLVAFSANAAGPHDGPDPIAHWMMYSRTLEGNRLHARLGPSATIDGKLTVARDPLGQSLAFDGKSAAVVAKDIAKLHKDFLPRKNITITAWVCIEEGQTWGGIINAIQDNGSFEKGWILGFNEKRFYFGLSSTGADDGDGRMTYLEGKTRFEKGKFYFVAATFDGTVMQLFVNGKLDGESKAQSGDILYPKSAPLVIGAYQDKDEDFRLKGRIREIAVYDKAAKPKWIAEEFDHQKRLAAMPVQGVRPAKFDFSIQPYLQYVTKNSITIMWETTRPGNSVVQFGESDAVSQEKKLNDMRYVHEVKIENLKPETQYFYKVLSRDAQKKEVKSKVFTFQTANKFETPFAFAIISDTQSNPKVAGKVATMAWGQRPNFLLHPGDLVGTGTNDRHWKEQFFPSMHPLISRVAFFPVLGNHEVNARNYYDYMSLPKPEYYYQFSYGNADFFMIDTNKNVDEKSEQYKWLDAALAKSKATWKFVCHHHPPYSSDENDYGNLWKSNKSTRGDKRVRVLTKLYDKHGVDIVWCGHIHSYERTWPLHKNKVVKNGQGPIYMITGGGGGGLETPGPYKPWFQNNVRRGHHYCMVAINGKTLEFKAFDLENRLFDYMKLNKAQK